MDRITISTVTDLRLDIGEGVAWDTTRQRLYLVDAGSTNSIHRIDPDHERLEQTWTLPDTIGSIALRDDTCVAATASGFAVVDLATGRVDATIPVAADEPTRLNDGKVSAGGRFYCVGMHNDAEQPVGRLYRLDPDLTVHEIDDGFIVGNGLAFSPDQRTAYAADTIRHVIYAYDHDHDTGTLSRRRLFADDTDQPGAPDGATVDTDGCLWSARWGGGRIVRYTPSGRVDRVIEMPVQHPTCPIFGGPTLETLYVTSALHWTDTTNEPLAGALFRLDGTATQGHEAHHLGNPPTPTKPERNDDGNNS